MNKEIRACEVDFTSIAQGAIAERANDAIQKAIENLLDPDTEPDKPRKVVIELVMTTNQDRQSMSYKINSKVVKAPPKTVKGHAWIAFDNGRPAMYENNPAQAGLNFNE